MSISEKNETSIYCLMNKEYAACEKQSQFRHSGY